MTKSLARFKRTCFNSTTKFYNPNIEKLGSATGVHLYSIVTVDSHYNEKTYNNPNKVIIADDIIIIFITIATRYNNGIVINTQSFKDVEYFNNMLSEVK